MLLTPNHGRYDGKLIRRRYEGSSVEIGAEGITWTPPSYRAYNHGRFSVTIGDLPGRAHAVTKIRTAFPSRSSAGEINRYVVTDTTGAILGSFPSGEGVTGSSLPEHVAGWYPMPAVRKAVEDAGLRWDDRDFTGDDKALDTAFPGAVPHLRTLHRAAWVQSLIYLVGGVVFVGMAVGWAADGGWGRFVFPVIVGLLGVEFLVVGTLAAPPVMRTVRQRHLARVAALRSSSSAAGRAD
ncbi:hypothetical protein [Cellulomonas soli]|uniref:Uncharacterized protein n=1 Tax=Cellulomonas soli TaxID=931535 RepID=A0A512PCZ6_9CELL|nr:hypothetical protein [Cellulomonas soli]NYI58601.1 hypothetical protein [Cellulomonas soli]GEP69026.1 hypothetical protein CSO01_17410 [Cellulomonas soli]